MLVGGPPVKFCLGPQETLESLITRVMKRKQRGDLQTDTDAAYEEWDGKKMLKKITCKEDEDRSPYRQS